MSIPRPPIRRATSLLALVIRPRAHVIKICAFEASVIGESLFRTCANAPEPRTVRSLAHCCARIVGGLPGMISDVGERAGNSAT